MLVDGAISSSSRALGAGAAGGPGRRLAQSDGLDEAGREVWAALGKSKDGRVPKLLALLSSPAATYAEATTALADLRSRASTKLAPAQLGVLEEVCGRSCSALLGLR